MTLLGFRPKGQQEGQQPTRVVIEVEATKRPIITKYT